MAEHQMPEVVCLSHDEFEKFLLSQDNELWDADHLGFEEELGGRPSSVDELMGAIIGYGMGCPHVYVFSSEDAPYNIACRTKWDAVPIVESATLDDYVIRNVKGLDFLYFACSEEQASNGDYITLLPFVEHDEDE